jgi:hypothetical protein
MKLKNHYKSEVNSSTLMKRQKLLHIMKLRNVFYWKQTPSINYYEQQGQLSEIIMAWI